MALRVLVVDDDPLLLELIEEVLTSKGAEVVTSDFPASIAELVRQVRPDVLLLDLISRTDGLAGVTMLGRLYNDLYKALSLPVLIMSADHEWLSLLEESLREVGVTVVPKPFDVDHLWHMIEQAVQSPSPATVPNASD